MVVALTVTPALGLILLAQRPARAQRVARSCAGCKRGYAAACSRRDPTGRCRRRERRRSRSSLRRRRRSCPRLGEALLPGVQGARLPDALDHEARHVACPRSGGSSPRPARSCARSPASRNFGSHIGQAFLAEEIVGVELRRELDQRSTRPPTTTRRSPRSRRSSTATPACTATCRPTCNERIDEVLTGSSEPIVIRIFGDDLEDAATEGRSEVKHLARGHPRRRRRSTSSSRRTCRRSRCGSNLAEARALRPQARRRAPRGRDARHRRGGRRHLPRRQGLRRPRVEHAGRRATA